MKSVEEHLAHILQGLHSLEAETVPIVEALGRTLHAPVHAAVDMPVFDNSAMDGFAVHFDDVATATPDTPVQLRVVADLPAGTSVDPTVGHGEAARIMTGSPAPTVTDTIVPFENTVGGLHDSLDVIVVTVAPPKRGAHVRRRGADAHAGDVVLPAGIVLGPLQVAAVAAAGVAEVSVTRCPRVGVISTGSELIAPGRALQRGQIPESNGTLLAGLARQAGAHVVVQASVPDDNDRLRTALSEATAQGADVVIFSGGVSAGAYEVVKTALGPGGQMNFSSVAMQPGKPQGFGRLPEGPMLFGLPGNPVSSAVSFEVFVRPTLWALQGRTQLARPVLRLATTQGWRTPPNRRQYLPVVIDHSAPGAWTVSPATSGGSHLAGGLARGEAYAVVPAEVAEVAAGDVVDVMLVS